jgi:IclR family transcriptional regulator, KDG regulon repressor
MNQSVIKALKLLELFNEDVEELSLKEIADEGNIPKPTAYRLLSSLEYSGYIARTNEVQGGKYQLGLKLLELGNLVANRLEVREVALPLMQQLAKEINEVIHLVIVNQNKATYIEKVESSRALRLYTKIGKSVPLYIGSGPKLLLAFLPEEKQQQIIHQSRLISIQRPINKEELVKELQQIKADGFAYSIAEQDEDTTGISYPIYNYKRKVVAALAVSGLSSRFTGDNLQRIKHKSSTSAENISKQLGYK